jgi:hypothetical protein
MVKKLHSTLLIGAAIVFTSYNINTKFQDQESIQSDQLDISQPTGKFSVPCTTFIGDTSVHSFRGYETKIEPSANAYVTTLHNMATEISESGERTHHNSLEGIMFDNNKFLSNDSKFYNLETSHDCPRFEYTPGNQLK